MILRNQIVWQMNDGYRGLIVIDAEEEERYEIRDLIKGRQLPSDAVVFKYHMGRTPLDLIATAYPGRYLLSDRVVQELSKNKFTGWCIYPVEVFGKDNKRISGYHGFSITGKAGPIDKSKYEIIEKPFRGTTARFLRGIYFDENSWDGSDIFLIDETLHICMVNAVYDSLKRIKPTNVEFVQLSEYTRMAGWDSKTQQYE